MYLVFELLKKQIEINPHKKFIDEYTFQEVFDLSFQLSEQLKSKNLQKQDRIIICFLNEVNFVISYFGILMAGGIAVTISPLLTNTEKQNILKHSGAKLILSYEDELNLNQFTLDSISSIPKFNQNQALQPDLPIDLAVIIYTSGTTSLPKGVMLTTNNIKAQIESASEVLELKRADNLLGILSFSHVFGQMDILWACLFIGASIRLIARFEAQKALQTIEKYNISVLIAVPTMYQLMIYYLEKENIYYKFNNLRLCHSGAAPLSEKLFNSIKTLFKVPIQEGYGLTETCSMAFSNPLNDIQKPLSVGKPIKNVIFNLINEEQIIITQSNEIGEICIKGEIISKGYFNEIELTNNTFKPDFGLLTGDLGYFDNDGYLYLIDRKKDLIIRAGYKVYPREIEEVLMSHPNIALAAVIGVKHNLQVQKIKAYIVSKNTLNTESEQEKLIDELKLLCKDKLAKYKIPNFYQLVEDIPKTPSGKLLKRKLL